MASDDDQEPRREVLREAVGGALLGAMFGLGIWALSCWVYVDTVGELGNVDIGPWTVSRWVGLGLAAGGSVIGLMAGVRMELRRTR